MIFLKCQLIISFIFLLFFLFNLFYIFLVWSLLYTSFWLIQVYFLLFFCFLIISLRIFLISNVSFRLHISPLLLLYLDPTYTDKLYFFIFIDFHAFISLQNFFMTMNLVSNSLEIFLLTLCYWFLILFHFVQRTYSMILISWGLFYNQEKKITSLRMFYIHLKENVYSVVIG